MAIWKRLQQLLQQQAQRELSRVEDPERLLEQAQEEMRASMVRNRERAVEAITAKNHLEILVCDLKKGIEELSDAAAAAERSGDWRQVELLREERRGLEESLSVAEPQWQRTIQIAEQLKSVILGEEERLRQKTAEALALRAQWKVLKIEQSLIRLMTEQSAEIRAPMTGGEVASRREVAEAQAQEAVESHAALAQMAANAAEQVEMLREKAAKARENNEETLERAFIRLMEQHEATLEAIQTALAKAETISARAQSLLHEESAWQSLRGTLVQQGLMEEPESELRVNRLDRRTATLLTIALLILLVLTALIWLLQ